MSESIWALDSTSLKYATAKHPVWYHKQGSVHFAPVTDGSNAGYVFYVDYSKIDDDSDLRNAVVFHSSSKEFEKLASAQNSDITTALTAMNTELDETQAVCDKIDADLVLAKAEVVLAKAEAAELASNTDNSSNFETACDAMVTELGKVDEICTLANDEFDEVAVEVSATATSPISAARTAAPSIIALSDLSIAAVPPDVPSLSTVSFSETNALSISVSAPTAISLTSVTFSSTDSDVDASLPTYTTATVSAGGVYGANTAPAYTKPELTSRVAFNDYWTLGDFGDSDPGALTISAVPPVFSISAPGVTTTAKGDISGDAPTYTPPVITTTGSDSTALDLTKLDTASWTAADYDFDDENIDPLKWFQLAGDFIQNEEDSELAAVQLQKINTYISAYQAAMQNKLNTFNKENAKYQANVQAEMQKQQHLASENTLEAQQTLEASIQDATLELQKYQAQVNDEVQEYSQKLARYQLELNTVFQAWQKTESDSLSQYQADIQNELNEFNKENISFQANMQESMQEIQVANQVNIAKAQGELQLNIDNENRSQQRQLQNGINDMQAIVADNERKIAQYQAEASHYATQVNQYIQNYTSRLQKDIQDTQAIIANNDDLLAKYQSELQQYTGEVQAELGEYQNKIQKQQTLSKEADKYYNWAKMEVNMYIQNNSKMIAATMASRSQAAQQQRS